jgi:hypothetical protein
MVPLYAARIEDPWPRRLREDQVHRLRPRHADPAEFAAPRPTAAADYSCWTWNHGCAAESAMWTALYARHHLLEL